MTVMCFQAYILHLVGDRGNYMCTSIVNTNTTDHIGIQIKSIHPFSISTSPALRMVGVGGGLPRCSSIQGLINREKQSSHSHSHLAALWCCQRAQNAGPGRKLQFHPSYLHCLANVLLQGAPEPSRTSGIARPLLLSSLLFCL